MQGNTEKGGKEAMSEKTVQITESERAALRKLETDRNVRKAKGKARGSARAELIRLHKSQFDALVEKYAKTPAE